MITVDDREGSAKYAKGLLARGLTVQLGRLPFGDLQFYGMGPKDEMWSIGIELKGLKEFCGDLYSPRFSGYQVPGMLDTYDRSYLVIKGGHRPDPETGALLSPFGRNWRPVQLGHHTFTYNEVKKKLMTIQEQTGITVYHVVTDHELLSLVETLHAWWYDGFDSHGSLRVFYEPKKETGIRAPSRFRRAVNALCAGIGWNRTVDIEEEWPTMEKLVQAEVEDFKTVDGLGPKLATQLHNSLRQ